MMFAICTSAANALKLQFLNRPAPVSRGYRAVVKDPFGHVLMLLDRSAKATSRCMSRTPSQSGALFAGVEQRSPVKKDLLIQLYQKIGRTADDLPYTPHFESLFEPYASAQSDPKPSRAEVWRHLLNLRKAGKLPKLGEARSKPPDVSPESRDALRKLLGETKGKRDRLPYTEQFDAIADAFNKTLPQTDGAASDLAIDRDAGEVTDRSARLTPGGNRESLNVCTAAFRLKRILARISRPGLRQRKTAGKAGIFWQRSVSQADRMCLGVFGERRPAVARCGWLCGRRVLI